MSARKLSRFAGLVLVLAAVVGGISAAAAGGELSTGVASDSAMVVNLLDTSWG